MNQAKILENLRRARFVMEVIPAERVDLETFKTEYGDGEHDAALIGEDIMDEMDRRYVWPENAPTHKALALARIDKAIEEAQAIAADGA